jgi:hypothetical protein
MAGVTGVGKLRGLEPGSLVPSPRAAEEPADQPDVERRSKTRFYLDLPVRYRTLGREPAGDEGRVRNISSGGLLVAHPSPLCVGARMELRIEWPSLLEGKIRLQLVAIGRVVRSEAFAFAVMFSRYQFKTAPKTASARASEPVNSPSGPRA